ncbi:ribbon-helix-helix domain-containing protein [Megamonas sp.]|mgnify:CR=1 FL=1|uniref:ribbon-helix-helix domain-containing protein n=1 Tax=Megamonas sp. TaxID=2049033 RepID=UPI00258E5DB9|nr:ribbon-helix-helix domain-containing protein [Megamonas sp.]
MSTKMGRPTDSPKTFRLQIRVDEQTMQDLDYCVRATGKNRSAIVRNGIGLVKGIMSNELIIKKK